MIRRATTADAGELARLRWSMRDEGGEAAAIGEHDFIARYSDWIASRLDEDGQAHFVAVEDGEVVGTLAGIEIDAMPRPCRFEDRWVYATNFFVSQGHRGRGLGEALLGAVRDWAATRDAELVLAWPSEEAQSLYRKVGFGEGDALQLVLRDDGDSNETG